MHSCRLPCICGSNKRHFNFSDRDIQDKRSRVDVRLCRKVFRAAADVDRVLGLVHSNIVNTQVSRESQVL